MVRERNDAIDTHAEELAFLVDAVRDYAIFLLSPDGEIRTWNRGAERIFGYQTSEVIGKRFSIFYSPADLKNHKPDRELEIAAENGTVEDEGWRLRKDGTRFWVNTIITALRDEGGGLRGFAKITRDLTEKIRAEEKARHSDEMFRLLVSSVQDYAIFMLDPTGNVASWNAGARRIKGYEPQEILGRHFSTFYTEEDRATGKPARKLEVAVRDGRVEDEGWRLRKDGTRFWAHVVITAIVGEDGALRGFAKVTRDMTDRKMAEETQRALLEQRAARLHAEEERLRAETSYRLAQDANRAKDDFLMMLSHELRTPMTAILGWSRLLSTLPPDDENFQEAVEAITRSAEHQARLIEDVLDVSRIISGKLRLALSNVDVARILRSAVEAVRVSAEAKNITIVAHCSEDVGTVVVDPTRLQQIVWNLLTNAVKFTPKGGRIELAAERTASRLEIAVSDSGVGIEPEFLPHIFEPFRQLEDPTTRVHGGLGLGLSIVRYLIEAHGGHITAESRGRGHGAKFTVTLPIRAMVPKAVSTPVPADSRLAHPQPDRILEGVEVLVVDDHRDTRELITATLRQAGAKVRAADSVDAAMKEIEQEKPQILITDVAMPVTDGFQFARKLRERRDFDAVKIIALSAFPASSVAGQNVFDAYLTKPIDPFEFLTTLSKLLQGKGDS